MPCSLPISAWPKLLARPHFILGLPFRPSGAALFIVHTTARVRFAHVPRVWHRSGVAARAAAGAGADIVLPPRHPRWKEATVFKKTVKRLMPATIQSNPAYHGRRLQDL